MIRLGIIGFGRMGITHYSIINNHPDVRIVGIAEPSSNIRNLLSRYISGLRIYKNYKNFIENEDLDALLVCTPPHLNYEIIYKAYQKGLHVFVEKPFTTSLAHAQELDFLYSAKGLVNQVGYVNRFNDVIVKAKSLVDEGTIGKLFRFKSEMFSCTISRPDCGSGWRATRDKGGGAVYEMASHAIDLVNFIVGKPDKIVGSSLNQIYSKNVEDAVSSTFLYKNGITGTIYINWSDESYRKPTNKIEIFGSKGKILADQYCIRVFLASQKPRRNLLQGWNTLYITDVFNPVSFYVRGNEFTRQLYHFIDCITKAEIQRVCTFKEGIDTLEIIDQIFKDFQQLDVSHA